MVNGHGQAVLAGSPSASGLADAVTWSSHVTEGRTAQQDEYLGIDQFDLGL